MIPQKLTIDQILPVCHLDELYDNNPVLYRKYTRLKAIGKLCKYRIFDLQTEQAYCRFPLIHKTWLAKQKPLMLHGEHYDMNAQKLPNLDLPMYKIGGTDE